MDDDFTLEAALSWLDEFPFDEAALVSCPQVTVGESEVALVARAPETPLPVEDQKEVKRRRRNDKKKLLRKAGVYGDPNRARNGRRLEIAYLKEQIEKLQADLSALQGHKRGRNAARRPPTGALIAATQLPCMWQAIADRQRKRREGAELENMRLKLVADKQRKVAANLRSLLQKRASQLVRFVPLASVENPQLTSLLLLCCRRASALPSWTLAPQSLTSSTCWTSEATSPTSRLSSD
jgi:hypothetical protein